MDDKGFALMLLILVAAGVFALAVVGWVYVRPYSSLTDQSVKTHSQASQPTRNLSSGTDRMADAPATATFMESSSTTSGWSTYRNNKYGFEVRYPRDWIVAGVEGGIPANDRESIFQISARKQPGPGVDFKIVQLGSRYLPDELAFARNLDEFVQTLAGVTSTATSSSDRINSWIISPLPEGGPVGGRRALWLKTCISNQIGRRCATDVYFQEGVNIYEIHASDQATLEDILSTFRFLRPGE